MGVAGMCHLCCVFCDNCFSCMIADISAEKSRLSINDMRINKLVSMLCF